MRDPSQNVNWSSFYRAGGLFVVLEFVYFQLYIFYKLYTCLQKNLIYSIFYFEKVHFWTFFPKIEDQQQYLLISQVRGRAMTPIDLN